MLRLSYNQFKKRIIWDILLYFFSIKATEQSCGAEIIKFWLHLQTVLGSRSNLDRLLLWFMRPAPDFFFLNKFKKH